MDLNLNVSKKGLTTTEEVINEEYTLRYGHIFRGEKGDKGADGKDGERGADGKSAYQQAVEAGYKGSEEDFKELLLSYPNKADKEGYYPNMSVGIADDVKNGNTKYLAATPSGDPMHYAYEALGARWNANTGYWEFYDMKDITTEQMRRSYNFGHINTNDSAPLSMYASSSPSNIRFNLPRTGANAAYFSSFGSFASGNYNIEVINLMATYAMSADKNERSQIVNANYAFNYCEKLRRVLSFIDFSTATNVAGMFNRCCKLEQINCYGLKQDISFADSPLLSKESLLYMINNCAEDVSFTITLHPDAYDNAKDSWGTEIEDAIEGASINKGTTITLASA